MTEPLLVDSSRLETAGIKLRGLVFPAPPPPIVAAGTDAVSAAINETLPIIESPVSDGLRDAKAALTKTGSKIAVAAGMYAETDQRLGEHLNQVQFLAADQKRSVAKSDQLAGAKADQPAGETAGQAADVASPSTPQPASQLDQLVPQLGQVAPQVGQMVGAMSPLAQNVSQVSQSISQSVQGATGSMSSGGMPAQLAGDSAKTEQSPTDQAQLVDETKADKDQQPETFTEGAAPGDQTSEGVPAESLTPGRPETTPSAVEL